MQQLADLDFVSASRIVNLPNPSAAQHAATKAYVDSLVEGLAWKDSCRVATQSNTNLASPGATVDGVTMATNDRVLVRAQTSQSENGIYIWNGAAVAMTRASDASTFDELENAVTTVDEGTSAGASFRQSTVNGTLGSSNVVWGSFGTGSPAASETTAGIAEIATQAEVDAGTDDARFVTPAKLAAASFLPTKYAVAIGDGSATTYVITHNLNTRDAVVMVRRTGTPYDAVIADVEMTSVNTATIRFAAAPTSNQFTVIVIG